MREKYLSNTYNETERVLYKELLHTPTVIFSGTECLNL